MTFELLGTLVSIILLMSAGAIATITVNILVRGRFTERRRTQMVLFGVAAFFWSFGYGCVGLSQNIESAYIIRTLGIIGANGFIIVDFWVMCDLVGFKKTTDRVVKGIAMILLATDCFAFSNKNSDMMITYNGYITWTARHCTERSYHFILIVIFYSVMLTMGMYIITDLQYRRQQRFILNYMAANIVMAIATVPDIYIVTSGRHGLPLSAVGGSLCFLILWIGMLKLNAFDISLDNLFNHIYSFVNVGILVIDNDHKVFMCNPCGQEMIKRDDIVGSKITDLYDITEEEARDYYERVIHEDIGDFHFHAKSDGMECLGRLSVALDKDNEPYCYIMVISDITNEVNMMEELRSANLAKNNFLTSMSHEIRTPINAVLGMNEMILRESNEKNIVNYASDIEKSGNHLLSLISDILDFTKIDSGKMELFSVNYDLSSVINDMTSMVGKRVEDKGLELRVVVDPVMPSTLMGDEVRINQVILNMLTNAIKYTEVGFITLKFAYEAKSDEMIDLIISVRDTGQGIEKDDIDLLFGSFTRLRQNANQTIEGTGLGLALTKEFVELMDGTIKVESVYGVGTRFTVVLPQKIVNKEAVGDIGLRITAHSKENRQYRASFRAPRGRILVVDDVEMNLKLVNQLIKNTELQIDNALGGVEALKKCKDTKYDVILMDHMMPDIDGIECFKRIRHDGGINATTPVIVLTANAVVGMKNLYLNEGFDDYLSKPIDGLKLEKMIRKFLPEDLIVE